MRKNEDHFIGCILGGAIGDALGYPIEFLKYEEIINNFGYRGIKDLLIDDTKGFAVFSDDTQLTLFTAEGILNYACYNQTAMKSNYDLTDFVFQSYLRWLVTQGYEVDKNIKNSSGIVSTNPNLYFERSPENTCLTSLLSLKKGTTENRINKSKGNGGLMRVAPVGLFFGSNVSFDIGMKIASITHGHHNGYLSAGVFSYLISKIIEGAEIEEAAISALKELKKYKNHKRCFKVISAALMHVEKNTSIRRTINSIGEGWVGEEAIALSIFFACKFKNDFKSALLAAVNNGGDSDTLGSITGNILGAYLGLKRIPKYWANKIEEKDLITTLSQDLLKRYEYSELWKSKYSISFLEV